MRGSDARSYPLSPALWQPLVSAPPTFPRERRVPAETLPVAGCVARDGNGQALVMDETHRSDEDTQLAYDTAPHGQLGQKLQMVRKLLDQALKCSASLACGGQ